ncbi:hypothetical protein C2845_PM12G03110 [Panicum miliaceum]|uniref:Integrase catalytic domain-containing protein n=1 Tax=Panicum miliaceum TaxID=4540 RepID=A0A3L6QF42_PANMI|nr:hypothetical protein C2845_PM12G03110 [Panicum miliaceum]
MEHLLPGGLLLPLPVPSAVWADVDMDFIEGLPKVGGKSVILTVVDRFSKYCHFIPLGHPYSAEMVAKAFSAEIVRLHGVPQSIVSDRDPVFTSGFWKELFTFSGAKLHMTTAFHPQEDGQVEAGNKVITMYLHCFTGDPDNPPGDAVQAGVWPRPAVDPFLRARRLQSGGGGRMAVSMISFTTGMMMRAHFLTGRHR